MEERKAAFERKRNELSRRCENCRKINLRVSVERCDECTIGRKLRMLEAEYADVTGWSHANWKTK